MLSFQVRYKGRKLSSNFEAAEVRMEIESVVITDE